MSENQTINVMLAFVSLVQEKNINEPIHYADVGGQPYDAIQTNESAIVAVQRQLGENPLSAVFLVCSEKIKNFHAPQNDDYGIVTHIDFLKNRLINADNRLSGKLIALDYYDDLDDIEESMRNVTYIAGEITAYALEHPSAQICLYADMTGGFRYNSTMMLAIMQLLQFNGIKLGRVLYSDPVKKRVFDATSLLGLFSLISGADEFVRFGSVETLQDYFSKNQKTKELDNLLQAMQRFSEAIKMCRTSIITDELRTLNVYLKAFKEQHGGTLQENLFASIVLALQNEYGSLLKGQAAELDIINWCVRKGFLQQAMTLCTEWLPAYLVKNKIAYADDPMVMLNCEVEGRKGGRSWQFYLISSYNKGNSESTKSSETMSLANLIKTDILSLTSGNKNNKLDFTKYPRLADLHKEFSRADFDFILLKTNMVTIEEFESKYPILGTILKKTYEDTRAKAKPKMSYQNYIYRSSLERIVNKVSVFPTQEIYSLFDIPESEYSGTKPSMENNVSPSEDIEGKWDRHEQRYNALYENGILKSNCSYKEMLQCLREYFLIRTERNLTNHANAENVTTAADIRDMILNILKHWTGLRKEMSSRK